MRTIIALLAFFLLAGCASVGDRILQAGTQGDVRFEPKDVDAAIAIADAAGDKVAGDCYRAIRKHVDMPVKIETVGPVSTYAAARIRIREGRAGLAPDVHTACAPLVLDAAEFARGFASTIRRAIP